MSELSQFLLSSDIHFYRDYAIPLIKQNPQLFDLDEFNSILHENESVSTERTIQEAYHEFELDKKAQYEMHPRFGRYVSRENLWVRFSNHT